MTYRSLPKQSKVVSYETNPPKYNSACLSSFIFYSGTAKTAAAKDEGKIVIRKKIILNVL